MKRLILATCAVIALIASGQQARADVSLQDFAVNINGTTYDYNNLGQPDTTTLPGMNATAFSTMTSGDGLNTGLGTLIYTFDPGTAGTYFVNFYFDEEAGVPFYNEYGLTAGSPAAGESWEIASVNGTSTNPSVGGIQFWNGSTQILPNSLDNTNHVPAGNTNYSHNCSVAVAPCNADVAEALGFDFTLTAGQEAVITVSQSETNPGGFYLEQVHPVDLNNGTATDLFLDGSVSIQSAGPPPPNVPEPSSLAMMGLGVALLGVMGLFRKSRADIEKQPGLTS